MLREPLIRAFPDRPTVVAGEPLVLHVATDAARFRVRFFRWGTRPEMVSESDWLPGRERPDHLPFHDWAVDNVGLGGERLGGWPPYAFEVGADWPPGVYVAVLVEAGASDPGELVSPDARSGTALFVVRRAEPAAILYKLPLFTYHAYNRVSVDGFDGHHACCGWSLYTHPEAALLAPGIPPAVSVRRPGGGTGGTPTDIWNFDPFDPTPRQTFAHWDAPFVSWLESNGYAVDYCTDLDLDLDPSLLAGRRLLVSVGHDEYWTETMRDRVERFVDQEGNVAFFGGNTCWWRVTFDDDFAFRRAGTWSDPDGAGRPENSITGVSFRNGGERDLDRHPVPVGYRVQHAGHWAYGGTGLADRDTFGDGDRECLVGYECDGAAFDRQADIATPSGEDGTPTDFLILGVGDLVPSGWGFGNRAATMGVFTRNGTVFNAATTDWARVLRDVPDGPVEVITRNVIDRLSGGEEERARPSW